MSERVYVSSTFEDLKAFRSDVRDQLRKLKLEDVAMEYYGPEEKRPLDRCMEDVQSCQLYIGIFAYRYGYIPDGETRSITEIEYEEAGKCGIERLVFILEDRKWPALWTDHFNKEGERGKCIEDLRQRLGKSHSVGTFNNVGELLLKITEGIYLWRTNQQPRVRAPADSIFRDYLEDLILQGENDKFDRFYVNLSATTRALQIYSQDSESELLWSSSLLALEPPAPEVPKVISLDRVEEAMNIHARFVLVGRPGCGKTTILKRIRLNVARSSLEKGTTQIPLLIKLSEWPDHIKDLSNLIHYEALDQIGTPAPPQRLLLLLDGVTKIDPEAAAFRIAAIGEWLKKHPQANLVVASREEPDRLGLPVVNVLPLGDEAVEQFVRDRLGEDGKDLLQEIEWEKRQAATHRDLVHLARNPFLLLVMCNLVRSLPSKRLPSTRGELIRAFVSESYTREERQPGKRPPLPTLTSAVKGFGALSVAMLRSRSLRAIDTQSIEKHLPEGQDAGALIRLGRGAAFIDLVKDGRFLEFSHPLLLEYFAAEYFLAHMDQLSKFLPEPVFEGSRRIPKSFDEVVLTLLNLGAASDVLPFVAGRDPFLAAAAVLQLPNSHSIGTKVMALLVERLANQIQGDDRDARIAAMGSIAQLGKPAVQRLRRLQASPSHWIRRLAVSALSQMPGLDAMEGVVAALLDSNRWVRRDAVRSLQSLDGESRELMVTYLPEVLSKMPPGSRERLGRALAECWTGTDDELGGLARAEAGIPADEGDELPEKVFGGALAASWTGTDDEIAGLARTGIGIPPDERGERPEEVFVGTTTEEQIQEETSADLGKWGYTWRAAWDATPGDLDLERQGRWWLKAGPREHPAWGLVWTALWAVSPGDSDLEVIGRRWLVEQSTDQGAWSYLWTAMWRQRPGDPILEQLGRRWLSKVSLIHPAWPYNWRFLWQANPRDPELDRLGVQWLEQTPTDRWGIIWPPLWEAKLGDPVLSEQGRRWLKDTGPEHAGWSYLWPRLWEANIGDPELEQMGRGWLSRVGSTHSGFTFIWEPLWRANPRDPNLEVLGHIWLDEVGPEDDGWGYVWRALHEASPLDDGLRKRGRDWLEKVPAENKSWTIVWQTFRNANPKDGSLLQLALGWIERTPASHPGWGHMWSQLRESKQKDGKMATIGRKWVAEAPPGHSAWGSIWKDLHALNPGDVDHLQTGRAWLERVPLLHGGWSGVWELVWAANPGDDMLERRGQVWLKRALSENDHWSFVWQALWKNNPDDKDLEVAGRSWLEEQFVLRPGWSHVWIALRTRYPRDPQLALLGMSWLKQVSSEDGQWIHVWGNLTADRCQDTEFLAITEQYLKARSKFDINWLKIWTWLVETGNMSESLIAEGRKRGLAYLVAGADSEEENSLLKCIEASTDDVTEVWTLLWRQAWDAGLDRERLTHLALDCLASQQRLIQWPFIWKDVYDQIGLNPKLMIMGRDWVKESNPRIHGWGLVWCALTRASSASPDLMELGWRWMHPGFNRRVSWPEVWITLWELDLNRRPQLAEHAIEWLTRNSGEVDAALSVWREVWAYAPGGERLFRWGIRFLACHPGRLDWPDVALALWAAPEQEYRPIIRKAVLEWIRKNRQHLRKEEMTRLVS